jgi:hypothetical protein
MNVTYTTSRGDETCVKNSGWEECEEQATRRRWEDNIKMDLKETGWEGVDCIHVAQDRDRWRALVNMVMNLWVRRGIH